MLLIARVRPLVLATPNPRHLDPAQALHVANVVSFWTTVCLAIATIAVALLYLWKLLRTTRAPYHASLDSMPFDPGAPRARV